MIHPDLKEFYSQENARHYVVAKEFIPEGTITWVRDGFDKTFSPLDLALLPKKMNEIGQEICFKNQLGRYVLPWDHRRYIVFSEQANTSFTGLGFEVAIKDIHPGERVTYNYGYKRQNEMPQSQWYEEMLNWVFDEDPEGASKFWKKEVLDATKYTQDIRQPLKFLIPPKIWNFFDYNTYDELNYQ